MRITNKKEPILLGFFDVLFMAISLFFSLSVRYFELPTEQIIRIHAIPFFFVFIISTLALSISGLYGKRLTIVKRNIISLIIKTQFANFLLALAMFYLVPFFDVTPKTNLIIYILISTVLLILWRHFSFKIFNKIKKEKAIIFATNEDIDEIVKELENSTRSLVSTRYILRKNNLGDLDSMLKDESISYFIADLSDPLITKILEKIYHLYFTKIKVVDAREFYMELFDKVPLGALGYEWILSKVNATTSISYDWGKRFMDIVLSVPILIFSMMIHPFIYLAIVFFDSKPCFIEQERIGEDGKIFKIKKYRTMKTSDKGKWLVEGDNRVTKIGAFLRKSRIDELPQVISVIKGDLSFIGPRPDIKDLGFMLKEDLPYYSLRTLIKPGLSGWAQVNQEKPPQSLEETRIRLSYDIYYVINRSLLLDFKIVLMTIKTILSRAGM